MSGALEPAVRSTLVPLEAGVIMTAYSEQQKATAEVAMAALERANAALVAVAVEKAALRREVEDLRARISERESLHAAEKTALVAENAALKAQVVVLAARLHEQETAKVALAEAIATIAQKSPAPSVAICGMGWAVDAMHKFRSGKAEMLAVLEKYLGVHLSNY